MEKHYNEKGEVGVLVSNGYGAGWSTWNTDINQEFLLMDKTLVEMFLNGASQSEAENYCTVTLKEDYICFGGFDSVDVVYVKPNAKFRIEEYDGVESLVLLDEIVFFTA